MGVGNIANSGLKAAMTNMESISNNIANVNTIGYKKTRVNFADIYSNSFANSTQIGFGVRTSSISQDFSLGRFDQTDNGLDLYLGGSDGFFVQRNTNGQTRYTRAGNLELDKDGYLNGISGRLQGYPAVNGSIMATGVLSDLQVSKSMIAANPTSAANLKVNFDSASEIPVNPFSESDLTSYNGRTDMTVYDSLGKPYQMSVFYIKTSDNNWNAQVLIDDQNIGSGSIAFQGNGAFSSASGLDTLSWTPVGGGNTPQSLNLTVSDSTQYSGDFKTYSKTQDGYEAGIPNGFNIDNNGMINVSYSNGLSVVQGQVAVAQFNAPQGLQRTDNMSWLATGDSGDPLLDPQSSINAIGSGQRELSNVDLTDELVKLMGAQHDFQANAQVAQTYNQVLQTVENI